MGLLKDLVLFIINVRTMTKEEITQEIKRTALENGEAPLGINAFPKKTGIKVHEWYGKYWENWNEALKAAGFLPNRMEHLI